MDEIDKNAKIIWDYMLMRQMLGPVDAIFALGSNDIRVAERAAELYLKKYGTYVICAGGYGKDRFYPKPEAEMFAGTLVEKGVPRESIIIENQSTNTGENVLFVKKLLEEKGYHFNSFILVQKPYMERRTYATFSKQWPGVAFSVTSPLISYEEYATDDAFRERFINLMVGDLQRIKEYSAKGFQIPQEIPDEVWKAYERLVELGFTKYLISK